jgi:uncharacterized cupin superfamily protein
MVMPKVADPDRAVLSLRALRKAHVAHLLVGDGACVFGNAYDAIGAALDARDGVLANRVNLDELKYGQFAGDPAPFTGSAAEIGWLLGADKLAYAAGRLRRGEHYCPYHWHTREEELFVVISGTPMLRTPRGTFALRAGDVIAFPATANGAHRLWNDADEDAVVLMVANSDAADLCFYPDSGKVMLGDPGVVLHDHPELDYFDGEVPAGPRAYEGV